MSLMNIEPLKIVEYETTFDYTTGQSVSVIKSVVITRASVQPLDFFAAGAITSLQEKYADRTVQAVKVYLKQLVTNKAKITRLKTGRVYEVHKVYDYNEFSMMSDHYKLIMYYVED